MARLTFPIAGYGTEIVAITVRGEGKMREILKKFPLAVMTLGFFFGPMDHIRPIESRQVAEITASENPNKTAMAATCFS